MIQETPHIIAGQSKYLWLIDAGHGGWLHDQYATKPYQRKEDNLWETKSFIYPDGKQVFEGIINRQVATLLWKDLSQLGIDFALIHDEEEDTPLFQRVTRADNQYRKHRNCIYLSIHSDKLAISKVAYPGVHADFVTPGKGSGCSVYTSKGQTKSDKVANIFCEIGQKTIPEMRWRTDHSDGDADMEADFYVLRKTDCPAILCETGFYDNRQDADWLTSAKGQQQYKEYLLQSILATEKLKPI